MAVFQGFLSRALHLCSEKCSAQKIKLLINVCSENGHSNTTLEKVTKEHIFSIKENTDTVKNDKTVKVLRVPKLG